MAFTQDFSDVLDATTYNDVLTAIATALNVTPLSLVGKKFYYVAASGNVFLYTSAGPRYACNIGTVQAPATADDAVEAVPQEFAGDTWEFDVSVATGGVAVDIRGYDLLVVLTKDGVEALRYSSTVPSNAAAELGLATLVVPSNVTEPVPADIYLYSLTLIGPGAPPYVRTLDESDFNVLARNADATP